MLIVAAALYFLPTIVASTRGHLSALGIFLLNLFLGWTLIGWLLALIWSCTGNTAANYYRFVVRDMGPNGPVPPPRSGGSIWLVLLVILIATVLLDRRRDFRDVRTFNFHFPSQSGMRP